MTQQPKQSQRKGGSSWAFSVALCCGAVASLSFWCAGCQPAGGFEEGLSQAGAVGLCRGSDYRLDCPGDDSCPKRRLRILFHCMNETTAGIHLAQAARGVLQRGVTRGLLKARSACHDSKLIRRVKTVMSNARTASN